MISSLPNHAFLLIVAGLCACADPRARHCVEWADAVNAGDIESAMALMTEDATCQYGDDPIRTDAAALRGFLEWKVALGSRLTLSDFRISADTVYCSAVETNEWLSATGINERIYPLIRMTFAGGRISSVRFDVSDLSMALEDEAKAAITGWAKRAAPGRLDRIMPGGVLERNGTTGRLWMELFEEFSRSGTES